MGISPSYLPDKLAQREVMMLSGDKFNKDQFDSLKDNFGLITREQFLEAAKAFEGNSPRSADIRTVFMKFCPTGEMSSAQFIKMVKDAQLLTKKFSAGDAELIYTKAKKAAGGAQVRTISFDIFSSVAIPAMAEKRGETIEEFIEVLAVSNGPTLNATQAESVRFHDDKSTYTGTSGGDAAIGASLRLDQLVDKQVAGVKRVAVAKPAADSQIESTKTNVPVLSEEELRVKAAEEEALRPLRESYLRFCPNGDMNSSQFAKMMKDAKVFSKKFQSGDADMIFTKAKQKVATTGGGSAQAGQKISFDIFRTFALPAIAEKRGDTVEAVVELITSSSGPTRIVTQAQDVHFHDRSTSIANATAVSQAAAAAAAVAAKPSEG